MNKFILNTVDDSTGFESSCEIAAKILKKYGKSISDRAIRKHLNKKGRIFIWYLKVYKGYSQYNI